MNEFSYSRQTSSKKNWNKKCITRLNLLMRGNDQTFPLQYSIFWSNGTDTLQWFNKLLDTGLWKGKYRTGQVHSEEHSKRSAPPWHVLYVISIKARDGSVALSCNSHSYNCNDNNPVQFIEHWLTWWVTENLTACFIINTRIVYK